MQSNYTSDWENQFKVKVYYNFGGTLLLYFILGMVINRNIIKLSIIRAS